MTPQEAINQLNLAIATEKILIKCSTMGELCHCDNIKAFETAISIIEKQIPQKAIIEREDYPEINGFMETYRCPICNSELVERDQVGFTHKLHKYCDCGQALDWSDT